MPLVEPVKAAIHQCFHFYNYSDAAFLSERLYAEVSSSESLYLLASSYYLMGKPWKAYMVLSGKKNLSIDCRYLLAKCCFELNKLNEAELALTKQIDLKKGVKEIKEDFREVASYALNILGHVCSNSERKEHAVFCFKESLQLNPFLWSSFKMLCELGDTTDPSQTFQVNNENLASVCKHPCNFPSFSFIDNLPSSLKKENKHDDPIVKSHKELFASFTPHTPDTPTQSQESQCDNHHLASVPRNLLPRRVSELKEDTCGGHNGGILSPLNAKFGMMPLVFTPSDQSDTSIDVNITHNLVSPIINTVASKTSQTAPSQPLMPNSKPSVFSQSGNTNVGKEATGNKRSFGSYNIGLRRSTRLFNHTSSSVKENKKNQLTENCSVNTDGARSVNKRSKSKVAWTPLQDPHKKSSLLTSAINNKSASTTMLTSMRNRSSSLVDQCQQLEQLIDMQRQSASNLVQLLHQIASAYQALSQYECSQAISLFNQLPPHHFNTGWVLCHVGKAYFEISDYRNAEVVFSEARRLEPHRLEGMDVYSTVLWHLQLEVELSALSHELTTTDKLSPEAWCATGNCFSLQKEHDTAIKFFQRAIQVDPSFTYAYTLLGHEYTLIEELDKAMTAFQNAIRINERHYNAWYGLGMVHYKQEKFSLACLYFGKALAINKRSSALLCHLGVVQHAQKDSSRALDTLDTALNIDPRNALCKFHKASILFAKDRPQDSLKELDDLKQIVPKESLVYFLIGRIHRKLGNTHLALINFSWAMDLDPKGTNNHIKETINKRYTVDDDDPTTDGDMSVGGRSLSEMSDPRVDDDSNNLSHVLSVINDTVTTNGTDDISNNGDVEDDEEEDDDEDFNEFGFMNIGY